MKTCNKCNIEKQVNEFYQRGKVCLECRKLLMQDYYKANKVKILEKQKHYHEENKDTIKKRVNEYTKRPEVIERQKLYQSTDEYKRKKSDRNKAYIKTDKAKEIAKKSRIKNKGNYLNYLKKYNEENKEKLSQYYKEYYETNKEHILARQTKYVSNKRKTDPLFKLRENANSLVRKAIQRKNYNKSSKTTEILGCSIQEFKQHLEGLFEPWMTWDNYGLYNGEPNVGWDIDHIIPSSSANTELEVIQLNHFSNLQPLCSYYNRDIKKDNLI